MIISACRISSAHADSLPDAHRDPVPASQSAPSDAELEGKLKKLLQKVFPAKQPDAQAGRKSNQKYVDKWIVRKFGQGLPRCTGDSKYSEMECSHSFFDIGLGAGWRLPVAGNPFDVARVSVLSQFDYSLQVARKGRVFLNVRTMFFSGLFGVNPPQGFSFMFSGVAGELHIALHRYLVSSFKLGLGLGNGRDENRSDVMRAGFVYHASLGLRLTLRIVHFFLDPLSLSFLIDQGSNNNFVMPYFFRFGIGAALY